MSERISIEVYVDYLCPYAHAGAVWLRDVRSALHGRLTINWKYFPLEQVNSDNGPDWRLWEQPESHQSRGWLGFRAAVAARQQGDDAFERFHFAWFEALHETPVGVKRPTVFEVAAQIGLDTEQFARDFAAAPLWSAVGDDYEYGRERHGVFGTPTIVFPNGAAAYLQIRPAPPPEEALAVWHEFVQTVVGRPNIREIKRPKPPVAQ